LLIITLQQYLKMIELLLDFIEQLQERRTDSLHSAFAVVRGSSDQRLLYSAGGE
jgi:hypothetical protein